MKSLSRVIMGILVVLSFLAVIGFVPVVVWMVFMGHLVPPTGSDVTSFAVAAAILGVEFLCIQFGFMIGKSK